LLFLEDAKSVSNFAVFSNSFLVDVFGFLASFLVYIFISDYFLLN